MPVLGTETGKPVISVYSVNCFFSLMSKALRFGTASPFLGTTIKLPSFGGKGGGSDRTRTREARRRLIYSELELLLSHATNYEKNQAYENEP